MNNSDVSRRPHHEVVIVGLGPTGATLANILAGYGLDVLFGTLPIFLVLFTLLGLAAGVKTMLRSAQEIQEKKLAEMAEQDAQDRD